MSVFAGRLSRKNYAMGYFFLLMVPALIGIIAAILLAALASARLKAQQAQFQVPGQTVGYQQQSYESATTGAQGIPSTQQQPPGSSNL